MAIIVNPSWKSKKKEDIVKYKDEEYEIGSTAFSSVSEAAAAGNTSDLVIVDKKLASPVKVKGEETPKAITGAATDVFKAVVKEAKSKDEKTTTTSIKFSAAAGGTATIKDENAALVGFDKITAKNAGGAFQGGKQDLTYSAKLVNDSDKGVENDDETVTRSSKATGSLAVTGKANDNRASAAIADITDSDMSTAPADAVKKTYKAVTGEEYNAAEFVAATYASVNLKYVNTTSTINGGNLTEKAVFKTTSSNSGEKTTENYSYSVSVKAGSASASVTDSQIGGLIGFKSVSIASKTASSPIAVSGKLENGNGSETYTLKTAYTDGKSYSLDKTENESSAVGKGTSLTVKGLDTTSKVTVSGEINDFDTVSLTWAVTSKGMESYAKTEKKTEKYTVKDQKGTSILTFNGTKEENETVGGKSLTATNTSFGDGAKGFATITFKTGVAVTANKAFEAQNEKSKTTKKQSGTAVEGITNDKTKYNATFGNNLDIALVSKDEAYTLDWTKKEEKSVGGTKFSASGEAGNYSGIASIQGFKTVDLNNSSAGNELKAELVNKSTVSDESRKESFTPDKAYSKATKENKTGKVVGSATFKGRNVTVSGVNGFASIKVNSSDVATMKLDNINNSGVRAENETYKKTSSESITIKAGKDNPIGNKTSSVTESAKAATELDATNVTLSGSYKDLKKAKLTNAKAGGSTAFTNNRDLDKKSTRKITWNASGISDTEPIPGDFSKEEVTAWDEKLDQKETVVGDFTLKNTTAAVTNLEVNDYKKVDITLGTNDAANVDFTNQGDFTQKKAVKRTVSATKRTQNYSDSQSTTAVGSLKITGNSATNTLTLSSGVGYSEIELKDVKLTGANAAAYAVTESVTATENATLASGDVTAVTLKYSRTNNKSGNGTFKASFTSTAASQQAFAGTLSGYGNVELKNTTINVGGADNRKYFGAGLSTQVVWNTDYFDVIGVNHGSVTATGTALAGNVTGSYTLNKGQIDSKWTGYQATLSGGTFTQVAAIKNVTAGDITGYDKVTLTDTKSAGDVNGKNTETTQVLTYKVGKDDEVTANSDVSTEKNTSSASFTMSGTKFKADQTATVTSINGYQTVSLTDASSGAITAVNDTTVTTTDNLAYNSQEIIKTAIGTLTAKSSTITGAVTGFQTVALEKTTANVAFTGGSSYSLENTTSSKFLEKDKIAAGSFTADAKFEAAAASLQVGALTGFQNVTLTDYKSGAVAVEFADPSATIKATALEYTPADADKETPETWQKAGATKSNIFTAKAVKANDFAVNTVDGYSKVDVSGEVVSVAAITNAFITDNAPTTYTTRIYGTKHYGSWTATAEKTETGYTAIKVDPGTGATIKGVKDKTPIEVTGDIAGYNNITLEYVKAGKASTTVNYAGGKYTYSTTTKDDVVKATSTNTASGTLAISNAQSADGTAKFAVEGFQNVSIDFSAADTKATFTGIVGGTEQATFTGTTLDTVKYTTAGSLNLKVDKASASSVEGKVAGFTTMSFTDVNFAADGDILAYSIPSKDKKSVSASVTFDNNKDGANTIAGDISGAKDITFKATADASDDFTVTGKIESNAKSAGTKIEGNTTVTFDKAQVTMAFANFDLDAGDVLAFFSETGADKTATLKLGDVASTSVVSAWTGVTLSGTGTVNIGGGSGCTEDEFKTALKAVASVADTITFTKG